MMKLNLTDLLGDLIFHCVRFLKFWLKKNRYLEEDKFFLFFPYTVSDGVSALHNMFHSISSCKFESC